MTVDLSFVARLLTTAGRLILIAVPIFPQVPSATSAREVVMRFCTLDAEGAQLNPGGRAKVAELFTTSPATDYSRIMVIKDFAVSRGNAWNGKTGFLIDYTPIGMFDSSQLSFSALPPSLEVRGSLFVVREQSGRQPDGQVRSEPAKWLIEGPPPPPSITVDAAIRYVSELRAESKDRATLGQFDRLLATLRRYRGR
jgi:hypothetical protein